MMQIAALAVCSLEAESCRTTHSASSLFYLTSIAGHITLSELQAALSRSESLSQSFGGASGGGQFTADQLRHLLQAADIDGDGTLSYNELVLSWTRQRLSAKEERIWQAFAKIDLNRSHHCIKQAVIPLLVACSLPVSLSLSRLSPLLLLLQ